MDHRRETDLEFVHLRKYSQLIRLVQPPRAETQNVSFLELTTRPPSNAEPHQETGNKPTKHEKPSCCTKYKL